MVVSSGVIPYQYEGACPFRFNPGEPCLGMSGILFEEAHFVAQAEQRRHKSPNALTETMTKYINFAEPTSVPGEATPNGAFLSDPNAPGMTHFIDYILNIRTILEDVFDEIANDCDYDDGEVKRDWLQNAAPSPSGGQFFRRQPRAPFGPDPAEWGYADQICTTSIEILGGSGVMYDVDLAQVRYQPYARMAASTVVRVTGTEQSFFVKAGPMWPAFQKTNGSLITLNAREQRLLLTGSIEEPESPWIEGGDFTTYDSVNSGVIQWDGDVMKAETHYMIATSGGSFSDGFTFSRGSLRKALGRTSDGTAQDILTRVFLTPQSQSEGLYRVAVRNDLSNLQYACVNSGTISQWPPQQTIERSAIDDKDGYSVFDESFWITNPTTGGNREQSSGLALISPFTGKAVWLRHADFFGFQQNFGFFNILRWGDFRGLERLGPDQIYRVTPRYFDVPFTGVTHFALVQYNDNLDYVTHTEILGSDIVGTMSSPTDLMYDPDDNKWICVDTDASGAEIHRFNFDFTHDKSFEASFIRPDRIVKINGNLWAMDNVGSDPIPGRHMQKVRLFNEENVTGNAEFLETKIIQSETIPGLSGQLVNGYAHDAQVLTSDVGPISAGIWLLYPGNNNMFLLRVIEDTTAFYVVEAIETNMTRNSATVLGRYDFIAMEY